MTEHSTAAAGTTEIGQPPADLPDWAYGVGSLVVFSGAGVSTDSGIQDFRGPKGAWTLSPGSQTKFTYQAFMADPELRVRYWQSRYEHPIWQAEPNVSHHAVAGLADSDIDTMVVTQNTDGLHQAAGTPADRVVELHGTMHTTICTQCERLSPTADVLARIEAGDPTPGCVECGGIQKTASTMFGQTMSTKVYSRAERAVINCDLILAVGTTLTVEPAGSLCASAVRAGATLVIVNWDPTPYDGIATDIIRDPLGEALPRIVEQLRAGASRTAPRHAPVVIDDIPVTPRPSLLLAAAGRTASFRSRTAELAQLSAWSEGTGTRAHLLVGPAGLGKSRLALELGDQLSATGEWDVEVLAAGAEVPDSERSLLLVLNNAETRQAEVAQVLQTVRSRTSAGPVRLLLLARTNDGWWDKLRSEADMSEELVAFKAADLASDYEAALTAQGFSSVTPDPAALDDQATPGAQQAAVLAGLLGATGSPADELVRLELAFLQRASAELKLPAQAVNEAVVTALLSGAVDEESALAALGHIAALKDDLKLRTARWLSELYASTTGEQAYWELSLPDALAEDLIASVITPTFLMNLLMETTDDQDRRALTVLSRAADTRPDVRACLVELLSVLPGTSPAAVGVALQGGYPAPLADALTSLAENAALPAELLDTVPRGRTELGEFPVLLAESLLDAYERRIESYPKTAYIGVTSMLIELAERLSDLGRAEAAVTIAQRGVESVDQLADKGDYPRLAAESLHRATELAGR